MQFERHEFNTEFQWQAAQRPLRRLTEAQARSWDDHGFFVLEQALDAAECQTLIDAIAPFEKAGEEFLRSRGGKVFIARADEITFTTNLAANAPAVRQFVTSRVMQDLCFDLLGPDVRLYWDMAVYKKPGVKEPFPWHQDNGYSYVDPQQYVTCWVALTDATPENGCPRVVPGAHKQGTYRHQLTPLGFVCTDDEPADVVTVPAKAGDIVVMSSLAPHATGPNLTSEVRKAFIAEYVPDGAHSMSRNQQGGVVRTRCDLDRNLVILKDGRPPIDAAA